MGKGSDLYAQQQQAKQLRAIERATAAASGQPLRKLSWTERNVLGVKDPAGTPAPSPTSSPTSSPTPSSSPRASRSSTPPPPPKVSDAARIAQLEGQVAALEARVQWAIDRIQELQADTRPTG